MTAHAHPAVPQGSPDIAYLHAQLPHIESTDTPPDQKSAATIAIQPLNFSANDAHPLQGHWFEPQHRSSHAVAVIAPATGVPQRYYHGFARWLAHRGYSVLCFEYRGMGTHRASSGRTGMREWVRHDLSGALLAAHARSVVEQGRTLPVLWIGHSLGGNGLPMIQGLERIDAAITVGSQLGYWKLWPRGWHRMVTRVFFKHWVPLCVRLSGKLPGWALGGGESLPGAAAMDWSRWGMSPGYFRDDPACAGWYQPALFRGHMQMWSIEDDKTFGPVDAVDKLAACFAGSAGQVERLHLQPRVVGHKAVGHFGVFKRASATRIWPLLMQSIEAKVPRLRGE